MTHSSYVPLVEILRGPIVESIHFGAFTVVDAAGKIIASAGDPQLCMYLRSSAKPFQALPFVERGGADRYSFSERELALICASHSGTDEHVRVLSGLQARIGITEADLHCGTHPVSDGHTAEAMIKRGEMPTPNRHNCSGKHTGMLAHCLMRGFSKEGYIERNHPVQESILQTFAEMCELETKDVVVGIDGCSVPTFAVPLYNAALAYARLADPTGLADHRAAACSRIAHAMAAHPDMVGGPRRFDTELMAAFGGKVVAKAGAEGFQTIALLPDALGPGSPALGIAIKVSDGDLNGHVNPTFPGQSSDSRARPLVAVELLRQLGLQDEAAFQALKGFARRPIRNWRKLEVGEMRPAFQI